jgi:hypothetical protein
MILDFGPGPIGSILLVDLLRVKFIIYNFVPSMSVVYEQVLINCARERHPSGFNIDLLHRLCRQCKTPSSFAGYSNHANTTKLNLVGYSNHANTTKLNLHCCCEQKKITVC